MKTKILNKLPVILIITTFMVIQCGKNASNAAVRSDESHSTSTTTSAENWEPSFSPVVNNTSQSQVGNAADETKFEFKPAVSEPQAPDNDAAIRDAINIEEEEEQSPELTYQSETPRPAWVQNRVQGELDSTGQYRNFYGFSQAYIMHNAFLLARVLTKRYLAEYLSLNIINEVAAAAETLSNAQSEHLEQVIGMQAKVHLNFHSEMSIYVEQYKTQISTFYAVYIKIAIPVSELNNYINNKADEIVSQVE